MNPILWILHLAAKALTVREIRGEDGSLYLSRYRILGWMPGSKWQWPISVYLHHFHRPDMDDAPHNHPWKWACSLILAGGYWEYRISKGQEPRMEWKGRFSLNPISQGIYHLVKDIRFRETWTLFVVGPKTTSWGFWVEGRGHVDWRARLQERGIPIPYAATEPQPVQGG